MKMKVFAVCLAVMCLMSCMCVTAFAADIYVQNGVTYTLGSEKVVLAVEYGVTYTITADTLYLPTTHNWTYASGYQELRFTNGVCEYTCTDETLKSIEFRAPSDTPVEITVTWPQPSALDVIIDSIEALFLAGLGWVSIIAQTVFASPLLLIFTVLPLVGLGVGIFYRLKG